MTPNDELKVVDSFEDISEETLVELSNGLGDDEEDD